MRRPEIASTCFFGPVLTASIHVGLELCSAVGPAWRGLGEAPILLLWGLTGSDLLPVSKTQATGKLYWNSGQHPTKI